MMSITNQAPAVLDDIDLEQATGGQTREHVLLSRQVGIPARAGDDDDDSNGTLLIRPDGP